MADAKRRQTRSISIDEAISQVGGEFALAQKLQTAVVSSIDSLNCLCCRQLHISLTLYVLIWSFSVFLGVGVGSF